MGRTHKKCGVGAFVSAPGNCLKPDGPLRARYGDGFKSKVLNGLFVHDFIRKMEDGKPKVNLLLSSEEFPGIEFTTLSGNVTMEIPGPEKDYLTKMKGASAPGASRGLIVYMCVLCASLLFSAPPALCFTRTCMQLLSNCST